ncbi:hypothetical protein [Streptomyces sp. NBC_01744]|uniref:hypothetical protein n=1 Tax=Streptomyces sp. NBC_01744 TaxID=2975927 RepID=UPI003D9A6894
MPGPSRPLSTPRSAGAIEESAEIFGRYCPERIGQMRVAAATGRTPSTDPAVLTMLIDDLAPWPAAGQQDGAMPSRVSGSVNGVPMTTAAVAAGAQHRVPLLHNPVRTVQGTCRR